MEKLVFGMSLLLSAAGVGARTWEDIVYPTEFLTFDFNAVDYLSRTDPFFENMVLRDPSETHAPTKTPTRAPTPFPTTPMPSVQPSTLPSEPPSSFPTETPDPYPPIEPPSNPPSQYFNYDNSPGSQYGPGELALVSQDGTFRVGVKNNNWGSVNTRSNSYWKEFTNNGWGPWKGVLENRDVYRNVCETGNIQSPIDVKENGATCDEHHEVRSLPGDFRVTSNFVEKQILPNKLRLLYKRRPCADLTDIACQEPDPPYADFPNGWSGFADVVHVDFKVPGEHTIWAEKFDAEMQIFHIHPGRRRMPTEAVLIRAKPHGYNQYFQEALDAFQYQFNKNNARCVLRKKRERQLIANTHAVLGQNVKNDNIDYGSLADYSTEFDRPDYEDYSENMERKLNFGAWDPHHPELIPTIHFYRYDGSLTEPPCGEWVTWFVADVPMTISFGQLEQMKTILFTNFDRSCRKTSVHFEHSVARPVRPTGDRPVWKCTEDDFGPDP